MDYLVVRGRLGRIVLLAALAIPLISAPRGYALTSAASAATIATVSVDAGAPGATIPDDFAGLSLEYDGTKSFFGPPADPNRVFRQLLINLGHGTLRIGGNSTDYSCWNPTRASQPFGCTYSIVPATLQNIFSTSQATGWPALIGVNLAQNNPGLALAYARDGIAPAAPPGTLLGLEIGNEPDLYAGGAHYPGTTTPIRPSPYPFSQYLREFNDYVKALKGNPTTARMPLVGPATNYNQGQQLDNFIKGVGAAQLGLTTVHYYPFGACRYNGGQFSIPSLLAQGSMDATAQQFTSLANAARADGLALQVGETNSAYCGGRAGISDAFASAAWGLDYLFTLASVGVARVNFHIGENAAYAPITSLSSQATPGGPITYSNDIRPLYYAMLLFGNAENKRLLPVRVSAGANVKAYAVTDGATTRVFIINKDLQAGGQVVVTPSQRLGTASALTLRAPALSATAGTTLGDQSINPATGLLPAPQTTTLAPDPKSGAYVVALPNASAVMLTITNGAAPTPTATLPPPPTATLPPPPTATIPHPSTPTATLAPPLTATPALPPTPTATLPPSRTPTPRPATVSKPIRPTPRPQPRPPLRRPTLAPQPDTVDVTVHGYVQRARSRATLALTASLRLKKLGGSLTLGDAAAHLSITQARYSGVRASHDSVTLTGGARIHNKSVPFVLVVQTTRHGYSVALTLASIRYRLSGLLHGRASLRMTYPPNQRQRTHAVGRSHPGGHYIPPRRPPHK